MQRHELELHTNERTRASDPLPPNYEPVAAAGRWRLLDGEGEILPGISARMTPGHIPWHQSLVLRSGGETAVFLGDVIPTHHHLPLAWIMGYPPGAAADPESKRALFARCVAGWWFIFEHDAHVAMGRAVQEGKGVGLAEVVRA